MTRAEIRREIQRVEKALAWAQKKTRTSFHLAVIRMDQSVAKDSGASLNIGRSCRGTSDKGMFVVGVNVEETPGINTKDLRRLAGHEVLHAILWGLGEASGKRRDEEDECATYALQRAIFGETGEP